MVSIGPPCDPIRRSGLAAAYTGRTLYQAGALPVRQCRPGGVNAGVSGSKTRSVLLHDAGAAGASAAMRKAWRRRRDCRSRSAPCTWSGVRGSNSALAARRARARRAARCIAASCLPNWASAFAFENDVDTCTPQGRQAPLAVSGSVSYTARTTSGASLRQESCTSTPAVLSASGSSVSSSFHSSAARPVMNST